MTIATPLNINEQIEISVSLAEGQFREFKSAYSGPPGQKVPRLAKDLCKDVGEALVAFANADGGEIIIGVEDDGEITGIEGLKLEDVEKVKKAPVSNVNGSTPLGPVVFRQATVNSKKVLYFRISKGTKYVHLTSDGRCLRRNDLESIPVSAEQVTFDRREVISREYDREFVDGASLGDLDVGLLKIVADQVSHGISIDRCLQYLGLAEYDVSTGLRLRRAALLLFAKIPDK
jgi:ATP-dependent DNA helicase RecG